MKYIQLSCLAVLVAMLGACAWQESQTGVETKKIKPYQENVIPLENLKTREVAYCYTSAFQTAEDCAQEMENEGFVRLKDIPMVTADRNILKEGTYPTRRWRETDRVSRW